MSSYKKHVVDELIEERAKTLINRPLIWPFIKRYMYSVLQYDEAIELVEHCKNMTGVEIFDYFHQLLELRLEVSGLKHIPTEGPIIIVANHPTGIADGFAVHCAVREIRPDICFLANRDAIRLAPKMVDTLVPVEWHVDQRNTAKTKEMLRSIREVFSHNRAVMIFPSGRLARPTIRGLKERPWLGTTVNLARKYNAPIVPLYMTGRNSFLYYFFYFVNTQLKDMTIFNEMMNKRGARFDLQFGAPIDAAEDLPRNATEAAELLRVHVESRFTTAV